jgi:hypothetical protein
VGKTIYDTTLVAAALDSLGSIKKWSGESKTIYKPHSIGYTELMHFSHSGFLNLRSADPLRHFYEGEELGYPYIYWPLFPRRTLINLAVAGACKSWCRLN